MIKDTISDDVINIVLRQVGAKSIKTTPAHVNVVKFDIGRDVTVTYLYEIKENGEIYLQRVSPYQMMIGKFFNDQSLINMIKSDISSFRNAYNSSNYDKFVKVINSHLRFGKEVESLFIDHNVSPEDLDLIHNEFEKVHQLIKDINDRSKPI